MAYRSRGGKLAFTRASFMGPEGAGKTHLLSIWVEKTRRCVFVPLDPILASIAQGNPPAGAFALDNADALAVILNRKNGCNIFLTRQRRRVVLLLTSRKPAASWGLGLRDIETRLKSALSVGFASLTMS